jgi:hypothetical protein
MQTFNQDRIAKLAYQLWQDRGCPQGSPEVDWERAVEMLEAGSADAGNEVLSAPSPLPAGFVQGAEGVGAEDVGAAPASPQAPAGSRDGDATAPSAAASRPRGKGRSARRPSP